MYPSIKKIKGIEYVYILQSKYDKEKKRSRTITLKYIGRKDKLTEKDIQKAINNYRRCNL